MRAVWLLIKFLLVVAVALLGAMFAMENSQALAVDFLLFSGPEIGLGLWLIIFLFVGTSLGILASSVIIANYRRKLARAIKKD